MKNPINSIEQAAGLDEAGERVGEILTKVIAPGPVKDALTGKWQGHPVHPVLTDLPIGFWTTSLLLDLVGGKRARSASDLLLGLGIASSVPTVAAGLADWVDTYGDERRVGLVHGAGNLNAIALYCGSYLAKKRGKRMRGLALSLAGTAVLTASGFLGGHLVYRLGSGVDQTRFDEYPDEWTAVLPAEQLPEAKPVAAAVGQASVMLYRNGSAICALADKCSHRGGPLHEGDVNHDAKTVTCPWHASVFDLRTGEVVRGPASAPQPCFEARISGDQVEIRRSASAR